MTSDTPPGPRRGFRHSIAFRIVTRMAATATLAVIVINIAFNLRLRAIQDEDLLERTRLMASGAAAGLGDPGADAERLRGFASALLAREGNVAFVAVRDAQGTLLATALGGSLAGIEGAALPACDPANAPSGFAELGRQPVVHAGARTGTPGASTGCVQVGLLVAPHRKLLTGMMLGSGAMALLVALVSAAIGGWLARSVVRPLRALAEATATMARGNLDLAIDVAREGEIGEVAVSFATMATHLRTVLGDIRTAAAEVERETGEILAAASRQAAMASQQAAAMHETSASASQVAVTARAATENADEVIEVASRADQTAKEGLAAVAAAKDGVLGLGDQMRVIAGSITALAERAAEIGGIVAAVKGLAEQSNLLALNASIEAARAEAAGSGFAVVATEMRALAGQSQRATADIKRILAEVYARMRESVQTAEEGNLRAASATQVAERTAALIDSLAQALRDSSEAARQIASSTRQQSVGIEQIAGAMNELSTASAGAVEDADRLERTAANLGEVSKRLAALVTRF